VLLSGPVIVGDVTIHLEDDTDADAARLAAVFNALDLQQHVDSPTQLQRYAGHRCHVFRLLCGCQSTRRDLPPQPDHVLSLSAATCQPAANPCRP